MSGLSHHGAGLGEAPRSPATSSTKTVVSLP
jgi:hypothetical protein